MVSRAFSAEVNGVRLVGWIIAIPVAFVVIAFAIANRKAVGVHFDPLPYELDIPLWAAVIGALAFGFILGAIIRWLFDQRWRREARQAQRHNRALEREISSLSQRLDQKATSSTKGPMNESGQNRLVAPRDVA